MDRRESIKSLVLGSLVGGLALESCVSDSKEELTAKVWEHQYGRTPKEKAVDQKLFFRLISKPSLSREIYLINRNENTFSDKLDNKILKSALWL